MKKKDFLWNVLAIVMVTMLSVGLSSCSRDDDEGSSANIPTGLLGTWYKTSGASKYSMNFTFNSDGTGKGDVSHNNIISYSSFSFTYRYKSNGDVTCDYTRVMVDEESEQTGTGTMVFNYSNGKLTLVQAPNSSWEGGEFSKD